MTIISQTKDVNGQLINFHNSRDPSISSYSGTLSANVQQSFVVPENCDVVYFKFTENVDVWVGVNTSITPTNGNNLLLQDGSLLLLQDNDAILLQGMGTGLTAISLELNPEVWKIKTGDIIYVTALSSCSYTILFYNRAELKFT